MEDKLKPAFLDAEHLAFIDAKNARIDAQRKVIEELVGVLKAIVTEAGAYPLINAGPCPPIKPYDSDSYLPDKFLTSAIAAIAKAKELTQ